MTRLLVLFGLLVLLCSNQTQAQKNYKVAREVVDIEGQPIIAATVVLLNLPDSSFADYSLTSDIGKKSYLC